MDFSTVSYWNISSSNQDVVQVSDSNNRVIWRCKLRDDEPLAFNNLGDQYNSVRLATNEGMPSAGSLNLTLYYSYDNSYWMNVNIEPGSINTTIPFGEHSKIYIRHEGPMARVNGQALYDIQLGSSQDTYLTGNILSLIGGQNFQSSSLSQYCLAGIYFNGVVSAEQVVFPNTTEIGCYSGMFSGNNTLLRAPILPATILTERCYYGMFYSCINLNYIKCLATDISASSCTSGWVSGVASTGTFITPNQSIWTTGINGIPSGWTVLSA